MLSSMNSGSEQATQSLAAALAAQCRAGDCLMLRGELGAGKTAFARGFIGALGGSDVVSPTFTLVQTYPVHGGTLWHFDLYRLKAPGEVSEIGLDEALQTGISLIEWPQLVEEQLPASALDISIAYGDTPDKRVITFSGRPGDWQSRIDAVHKECHA